MEKARHRNSETSGLYDEVNKLEFNTLQELIQTWKENENFKKSDKTIEEKSFPLSLYVILTDDKKESPILLVMDRTRTPHELFLKTHLNAKRIDITPLTLKNCELLEKCPSSDLRVCFDDNIPGMKDLKIKTFGTFCFLMSSSSNLLIAGLSCRLASQSNTFQRNFSPRKVRLIFRFFPHNLSFMSSR